MGLLDRLPLLLLPLLYCGCTYGAIDVGECDNTRGCFRVPEDCASEADCSYIVTWKLKDDDDTQLEIQMSGATDGWVGVAFSKDKLMGPDDTLIACVADSPVKVQYYVLTGRAPPQALSPAAPADSLDVTSSESAGGRISCEMTRPLTVAHDQILDLDGTAYFLLLGVGPASGGNIGKHSATPAATGEEILLTSIQSAGAAGADPKLKAHGILMLLAWVTFAGIGLMTARYYKSTLTADDCMQQKVWFTIHRSCMVVVFLFTVAAFVIIFVHVKGFSDFMSWSTGIRAHPILGVIVTFLGVLNPIIALFRPHPGTPNRVYFNWIHWAIGTLAHILGMITIFMGVNINSVLNPNWLTWIMVGYVAVHAICEIILEVHKCQSDKPAPGEEMQMKGGQNAGNYGPRMTQGENHSFKKAILAIYSLIVIILGVIMAVVVGLD